MLIQQRMGSGVFYTSETLEFCGEGDEAMIRRSGQPLAIGWKKVVKDDKV